MKLETFMLEDLIHVQYKEYGDLKGYGDLIDVNIEDYLNENKDEVVSDYKTAESEGVSLYNSVEVRTQILKDNLITEDFSEDYSSTIYQDVDLESIAETLLEITVVDLERELSHYGNWQVHLEDGFNSLVDFS